MNHKEHKEHKERARLAVHDFTYEIIGAAIEVHRHLGPGLLESAYERCLAVEMTCRGLSYARQWPIPVTYKDIRIECGYRADFLVEGSVIVELKSVSALDGIHTAQVISYLRLADLHRGLLLNFNVRTLNEGIRRISL